ncbi:MAG TPA: hypothetical protein VGJ37_02170 [Pyrinomonadaceae bacterium]
MALLRLLRIVSPLLLVNTITANFCQDGKLFVKVDGNEHAMTKSGDRKFTFGAQNENKLVFVPDRNGKIDFIFTELYGAKRVAKTTTQ